MASGRLIPVIRHLRRVVRPTEGDGISDAQLLERFVHQNDEAAFELLLWRHGPMVWGLCRRILQDHHEAEDAFQATALILARKARSIGQYHSVASWLYKAAYRIALRAKGSSLRRARFIRQVRQWSTSVAADHEAYSWIDLPRVIDEELNGLPEKYRAPVVLCYLQNKTNEEAAKLLRWPVGTVKSRLTRARELLSRSLGRRGVTLSATGLASVLTPAGGKAALPAGILNASLEAAMLTHPMGVGATGLITSRAVLLTEGALKAMFWSKVKIAAGVILTVGTAGVCVGTISYHNLAAGTLAANPTVQSTQEPKGKPARHVDRLDLGSEPRSAPGIAKVEKSGIASAKSSTDKEKEIEAKLNSTVSIDFKDTPLRQILDDLRSWSGINIVVDRTAQEGGLSLDRRITMKLDAVSFKTALSLLLRQVKMEYAIGQNVLMVIAPRSHLRLMTYKVGDLVSNGENVEVTLLSIIKNIVEPDSWESMGGRGTIDYFPLEKGFVINQTPEIHERIEGLLEGLRKMKDQEKETKKKLEAQEVEKKVKNSGSN